MTEQNTPRTKLIIKGFCVQYGVVIPHADEDDSHDRMFALDSFTGPRVSFDLPLLLGHDYDKAIGKVRNESLRRDGNFLTFEAEVYCGEVMDQIKSGSLRGISIGADYAEVLISFPKHLKTITAFAISEISVVSAPAERNCYITGWYEVKTEHHLNTTN